MHLLSKRTITIAIMALCVMMLFGIWAISNAQGSVGDTATPTRPDLSISANYAYWGSYSDYLARDLTVNFDVSNAGPAAVGVAITGASANSGVTLVTATPVGMGDIAAGGSTPVNLVYDVPEGVSIFVTNISASASDSAGRPYEYPANPDNTLVYSANVKPAAISVIDVDSQTLVNNFFLNYLAPTDQQGHFLSVSPDGNSLWVSEQISATGGYVAVLDANTGQELKHWDVGAGVGNHMSRDGRWLFVASNKISGINVFDVENQTYLGSFALGAGNHVMDSSPDDTLLWVTDMGLGNLRSFDTTGLPGTLPTPVDTIHIGGTMTHALLAHPNGKYVMVGSSGTQGDPGTVIVDVQTNTVVLTQAGHMPGGPSLHPHNYEISPDQKYLVIGDIGTYT